MAQKLSGREVTPVVEAPKIKSKKGPVEVTFDLKEDLKSFKTEQKKIVTLTNEDQTLKKLFITQDEHEAIEEFEKAKEEQVVGELGKQVEAPKVARGWNEWAGDGVNETGFQKRAQRVEELRKKKIDELKKQRADAKLKGVIIS